MRFKYKEYPLSQANPAFPKDLSVWAPFIPIRLNSPAKHITTPVFEACVDSGSPYCYFHADIGRALGIDISSGAKDQLGGIIHSAPSDAFFHNVAVIVGADSVRVRAGFCQALAVAGILGRNGFFDSYVVTFDQSAAPPQLVLERIRKH